MMTLRPRVAQQKRCWLASSRSPPLLHLEDKSGQQYGARVRSQFAQLHASEDILLFGSSMRRHCGQLVC